MSGDEAKKKLRKKQLEQQKKEKERKRKKVQEDRKKAERKHASGTDTKKNRLDELSKKRKKETKAAGAQSEEKGKRRSQPRAESRGEKKKGSRLDELSRRRGEAAENPTSTTKRRDQERKEDAERRTPQRRREPRIEVRSQKAGESRVRGVAEKGNSPTERVRPKRESDPRRSAEEKATTPESVKPKEPGKDPTDDWQRFMADLIADVTDIDKMVDIALERMENRQPSKSEAPHKAEPRPQSKAREKTPSEPPPTKRAEVQAPEPAREQSEPYKRQRAEFVAYNTTELDRTKSDLAGIKIKGQSFMQAAKKINRGGYVPVLLVEGQKVYGLKLTDPKDPGELLGDVIGYWLGSSGTNRPATNLKPGTYIVDRKSRDVYDAPSGKVVGKISAQAGRNMNDMLISGDVGIFLTPVGRSPHRHIAFRDAIEGQQLLVVRVPHEKDMMPREANSFKLSEAFARSTRYLAPETANTVRQMADHPLETILMSCTGKVGTYLFGTQAAMRLGTANAIALTAETPDALDVAARIYARVIGETGIMAALWALTKGAAAGLKAGVRAGRPRGGLPETPTPEVASESIRRAAAEETPSARRVRPTEDPATADTVRQDIGHADTVRQDVGHADTVQQDLGRADTVRAEAGGVSQVPSERDFNYFRDNYFSGDSAKARKFLRNVYEGDLEVGIKGMEFRRRLDPYLEGHGGSMDAPTLRELIRNVDKWYDQHFTGRGTSGPPGQSRPTVRGATAEGMGDEFTYRYHPDPTAPEVVHGTRSTSSPVLENTSGTSQMSSARPSGADVPAPEHTSTSPSDPDVLNLPSRGQAEEVLAGLSPEQLTPREVWEPPPGAPGRPPDSAPLDVRRQWLRERLQMHVDKAVQQYNEQGLTTNQEAALVRSPNLERAFRGSRIDQFAKDSILQDPALADVITAPDFINEPDILDSILPAWFDVTTRAQWCAHLERYQQRYGQDASLLPTD